MFRLRTPGMIAAGGLALLAGCKHHHQQQPVTDVPMVHAPFVQDTGAMAYPNPAVSSMPVGMIAGPVPRPYIPPTDPVAAEPTAPKNPVTELPPPADYAKIPPAIPQSRTGTSAPINIILPNGGPGGGERPATVVIPPTKRVEAEPAPTGPVLTGLPASSSPDPFVAAPNRVFGPAPVTEVVTAPKDTTPELQPMKLKPGERFGHGTDYRWVAGVLDKHQRGGYWTLRYADFAADDVWGGKVRLIDDPRLATFRNGDYVYLEGDLLAPLNGPHGDTVGYPPFRINQIRPVDKGR
ncbi:hypothetical protein [Zavarzinella formosa]|uniref:hypothetical protein n=1 Tax=Zavarzinella formosa TaxID=360055 RepID=UPI0012FAFD14|nr:hypothetical protein [Zavarzinella formosa]